MTLEEQIAALEDDDRSHRARLLILLLAYHDAEQPIALNLVRLAYLDYFLRYPTSLERVLRIRGHAASRLKIEDFERNSIESQFGALRVEPWDSEYRRWLAAEFAAGRIAAKLVGNDEFSVGLSDAGITAARLLQEADLFEITYNRALTIVHNLNLQIPTLRQIIRNALPETLSLLRQTVA